MSHNKCLRPLTTHANRLFRPTMSQMTGVGAKRMTHTKASYDIKTKIGFSLYLGGFLAMLGGWLYIIGSGGARPIIGKPAPAVLKDPNNPNRLVWSENEVVEGGQGDGAEGRSAPVEVSIVMDNNPVRGYRKVPGNGRSGFLNELVYHELAKKVLPGLHPHIKLIETSISPTESSYELFIESIGDNSNLLQFCMNLGKNPEEMEDSSLNNLGCALAFAVLILSADNFMKNFVVVYDGHRQGFVYPIDFEMLDYSKNRDFAIEYVDLKKPITDAMKSFISKGALLDYKDSFRMNEHLRAQSGAEDAGEIGKGWIALGMNSRLVYQYILKNSMADLENGNILFMYKNIAALDSNDIAQMINKYEFFMTETEMNDFRCDLRLIVEQTQEFVAKFEHTPGLKP